jgi:hypothetical protein
MTEGGSRKLNEGKGDRRLLCLLLHVCAHLLVWCHDSLHLHLPAIYESSFSSFKGRFHDELKKKFLHLMHYWFYASPDIVLIFLDEMNQ